MTSPASSYTSPSKPSRPLSNGFSTLPPTADRPSITKSASESNLPIEDGEKDEDERTVASASAIPDFNSEVAALSNKLINAINHQTKLDDSLAATSQELEIARKKIIQLEAVTKEYADRLAEGVLVEKKDVDGQLRRMQEEVEKEKMLREQAEKDKRNLEIEMEQLSAALFTEANAMVEAARKDRDSISKTNDHLKAQLADTELLLASQQEQLSQLKDVMQHMEEEEAATRPVTPVTGIRSSRESLAADYGVLASPEQYHNEPLVPVPPTSLPNIVLPLLRFDIPAYNDFCELVTTAKFSRANPGRNSGGSFSSASLMGFSMTSPSQSPATGLGSSFFGKRKAASVYEGSGTTSAGHSPSNSLGDAQYLLDQLKSTKFYKRVMLEDIEPALRLENSPGLSWLARRGAQTAITKGTLVIDPNPAPNGQGHGVLFPCSLCGETKSGDSHARTHYMRINEDNAAQRYPLCGYCVSRLRSVCDFMVFIRGVWEGIWKCDTDEELEHAWEESVKLRERMFWARIGGGVVPTALIRESRRNSGIPLSRPQTPIRGSIGCLSPRSPEMRKTRCVNDSQPPEVWSSQPSPLKRQTSHEGRPQTRHSVKESIMEENETPLSSSTPANDIEIGEVKSILQPISTAEAVPENENDEAESTKVTMKVDGPSTPTESRPIDERPSSPSQQIPGGW